MLTTLINWIVHVSFLLCIGMIIVVARRCQHSQMRSAFLIMLSIMGLWNLGTFLEFDFRLATGVTYMLFIYISYIGICFVPVAIFCLGRIILQPDWQLRPVHALLLVIPTVSIVMVITNPIHSLFFVEFSLSSSEAVYGAYYYFHSIYSYGCVTAGIVLMLVASARSAGLFSKQSMLVIAGIVITTVPNMMYSFGAAGDLPFGVSGASFTFSLMCFALAFLKYRFITALPITLRQVVDLISDGYLVVDKQLCILSHNQALMNIFPGPPGITLGENLRAFFGHYFLDISYERFLELQALSAELRETVSAEAHILGDSYVRAEITPVMQHRVQIGSIILFKDITQSRLLIEATQAASRAKGDFLSHMSHEIRTPLNAIIGMINIGMNAEDIGKKNYCFERADSASKHLLSLINDVLDMSKIEADKFELSYCEFDFEKMLVNIANVANVRAEEKKQAFIVNLGAGVPSCIVCDELRLSQVITNLLTNAIKFTPEKGSVILSVEELERLDDDEVVLRFEVADSGIGISKEHQERLFASFSQADASITTRFGGTGLGLAISKRIVEFMGGEIWVESELGRGSKFIFTIKAIRAEGKPRARLSVKTGMENVHILAVDSSLEVRAYFSRIMDTLGLSCNLAQDGAQALDMIRNAGDMPYSIFFIDWHLDDMSGTELASLIREINSESSIILTGSTADWSLIEKEADAAGIDHFVSKPIFPSDLINAINSCIGEELKSSASGRDALFRRRYDFAGYTLLIAEDIEINREIMGAILEDTKIAIDYAEDGNAAVSMFQENPEKYSLILMDVNMPGMDGHEATMAIRALDTDAARRVPIIAMTANVFKEDIDRCLECGMNGHTGKPVDIDALLEILNGYLTVPSVAE